MDVIKKSSLTGKVHKMDLPVTQEQLDEMNSPGRTRTVQDIFPKLTADQREFILSGITPEEWKEHFGDDEDD